MDENNKPQGDDRSRFGVQRCGGGWTVEDKVTGERLGWFKMRKAAEKQARLQGVTRRVFGEPVRTRSQ